MRRFLFGSVLLALISSTGVAAAEGSRSPGLVLEGRIEAKGLSGSWRRVVDPANGRWAEAADLGLYRTYEVWDGRRHWRVGRSGAPHLLNSAFARHVSATEAWLAARGFDKPLAAGARMEAPVSRFDGGHPYRVVRATPTGGEPVELWFDPETGLLARTVERLSASTREVRYSDWRATPAGMAPFETETTEGGTTETRYVSSASVATAKDLSFPAPPEPNDFSVSGGKTEVPVSFDGFVVVDATINGKGPFPFILDSGGRAILTPATAETIGVKTVGASAASGAGTGSVPVQFAKADTLTIGGATIRGLTFAVLPYGYDTIERGAQTPLAGVLGLELFERFAIRIDYRSARMRLQPLDAYQHHGPGRRVEMRFTEDMPVVTMSIDGRPGDAALDTGNPEAIAIQGFWASRYGLDERFKRGLPLTGAGGVGGQLHLWASRADLVFADVPMPHVAAFFAQDPSGAFSSISDAANVGNGVLSRFTVDFDYRRGELWLEPSPGFVERPWDRAGLSVEKPRQGVFTIDSVTPGGPAEAAGLKAGDEITAVDGKPAASLSGWDFGRLIRRPVGTRMTLAISVGDSRPDRDVVLTLRELLP